MDKEVPKRKVSLTLKHYSVQRIVGPQLPDAQEWLEGNESPGLSTEQFLTVLPKPTLLGRQQAKKRLQAFGLTKSTVSPAKKIIPTNIKTIEVSEEKFDENGKKVEELKVLKKPPLKAGINHDEKSKGIIEEIESIKKLQVEAAINQQHYFKHSRSRSREKKNDKRHWNSHHHRNGKKYPSNWSEVLKSNLSFEEIRHLETKKQTHKPIDATDILLFKNPSVPLIGVRYKSANAGDQTVPPMYVRFTKKHPKISYSVNQQTIKTIYFDRETIFKNIPKQQKDSLVQLIEKKDEKPLLPSQSVTTRQWFPRTPLVSSSEIIETSLGLTSLQNYEDEDEPREEKTETISPKQVKKLFSEVEEEEMKAKKRRAKKQSSKVKKLKRKLKKEKEKLKKKKHKKKESSSSSSSSTTSSSDSEAERKKRKSNEFKLVKSLSNTPEKTRSVTPVVTEQSMLGIITPEINEFNSMLGVSEEVKESTPPEPVVQEVQSIPFPVCKIFNIAQDATDTHQARYEPHGKRIDFDFDLNLRKERKDPERVRDRDRGRERGSRDKKKDKKFDETTGNVKRKRETFKLDGDIEKVPETKQAKNKLLISLENFWDDRPRSKEIEDTRLEQFRNRSRSRSKETVYFQHRNRSNSPGTRDAFPNEHNQKERTPDTDEYHSNWESDEDVPRKFKKQNDFRYSYSSQSSMLKFQNDFDIEELERERQMLNEQRKKLEMEKQKIAEMERRILESEKQREEELKLLTFKKEIEDRRVEVPEMKDESENKLEDEYEQFMKAVLPETEHSLNCSNSNESLASSLLTDIVQPRPVPSPLIDLNEFKTKIKSKLKTKVKLLENKVNSSEHLDADKELNVELNQDSDGIDLINRKPLNAIVIPKRLSLIERSSIFPEDSDSDERESEREDERKIVSPRNRLISPRGSLSPRNRSDPAGKSCDSPRKSCDSPRKSFDSTRKSFDSGRKSFDSTRKRSDSARNRSNSPRQRSDSDRKRSNSPRNDSTRNLLDLPRNQSDLVKNRSDSVRNQSDLVRNQLDLVKNQSDVVRNRSVSPVNLGAIKRSDSALARNRSSSPIKRSDSGRNRSVSTSPRSLRRRARASPRRSSISPRRRSRSTSPRRRSRSITPRSVSPRRKRSRSPRKRSRSPRTGERSPSRAKRTKTETIQQTLQRLAGLEPYMPSKSPGDSPMDGLKRSLADSTISDEQLLQQPIETVPPHLPVYNNIRFKSDATAESPKRIPLDVRINQVLGLEKEDEPKPIVATYSNYVYTQNQYYNHYEDSYNVMEYENKGYSDYRGFEQVANTGTTSKVVQVGNVLQVVPTEDMPESDKSEKSQIVQIGNMLQIVPTPEVSLKDIMSIPVPEVVPFPVIACITSPSVPVPPPNLIDANVQKEKQSAEELMKQKLSERMAERELRRLEREKRRAEKERKQREREKHRQMRLKQKNEEIIREALMAEVEENETDEVQKGEKYWPPLPLLVHPAGKTGAKGILVNAGFKLKDGETLPKRPKKGVKFADGIIPGEGTSPSGGEELSSPPPVQERIPKEKRYTKTKKAKKVKLPKKKVKVKVHKSRKDEEDDILPPPSPPPGSPPPHLFPPRVKTPKLLQPFVGSLPSLPSLQNLPSLPNLSNLPNLANLQNFQLPPLAALHHPFTPPVQQHIAIAPLGSHHHQQISHPVIPGLNSQGLTQGLSQQGLTQQGLAPQGLPQQSQGLPAHLLHHPLGMHHHRSQCSPSSTASPHRIHPHNPHSSHH